MTERWRKKNAAKFLDETDVSNMHAEKPGQKETSMMMSRCAAENTSFSAKEGSRLEQGNRGGGAARCRPEVSDRKNRKEKLK